MSLVKNQAFIFDHKRYQSQQALVDLEHDLFDMLAQNTIDRLKDMNRSFEKIAVIGACSNRLKTYFKDTQIDHKLIEKDYDLIICDHYLHALNQVPEFLMAAHAALKPDGLFLASSYGAMSFSELKQSFLQAEMQANLPIKSHISPFLDLETAGALMQKIGFQLPVVDTELQELHYAKVEDLFEELKTLGETNYLTIRHPGMMGKNLYKTMKEHYQNHYKTEKGKIYATIEVLNICGWKRHENQQQPLKRGSAEVSISSIFNKDEA